MPEKDDTITVGDIENSVADDLRESFAAVAKETAPEAAPEAVAPEAAPEGDKPEGEQDGRARDDKGRFVAKDGVQPPEQPIGEKPAEAAESAEQPEEEPLEPPVEWPLDKQQAFRQLPVAQQKFVMEQVGGVSEKLTEAEKATGRFKALDEVLAPRRAEWAREGLEEHMVLRQLLALTDQAKADPIGFIKTVAAHRGIDLRQLVPQPEAQPDPNDPYANDPVMQRVNQELAGVRQQLTAAQQEVQRLNGTFQTRQQQEEQARVKQIDTEITSFSSAKDEKGNLKNPYFPIVRSHMSALIDKGLASDLNDAYDQACHANPEVRAKIAAAKDHAVERERARLAKDKAAAARNAGSSVSGTPVTTRSEPQSTGDATEDLRAAFAAARGASAI